MAKRITGRQVIAYTGSALFLSLSLCTKKCPPQKAINIDARDTKSEVKPNRSFLGKSLQKSFCWYREVRMERNKNKEVTEKPRATSEGAAKMSNALWLSRIGVPLPLTQPGTMIDAVKAMVATNAATSE